MYTYSNATVYQYIGEKGYTKIQKVQPIDMIQTFSLLKLFARNGDILPSTVYMLKYGIKYDKKL